MEAQPTILEWRSPNEFVLGGVNFTVDLTAGNKRRQSTLNNFTIVKTENFLRLYEYLSRRYPNMDNIIELGVFQGGGFAYLDGVFKPKILHGVDITSKRIPPLDTYCTESSRNLRVHYETSQDDKGFLEDLVKTQFSGKLDMVVDDASHTYELTRKSFEILFPLLKPGGIYVIEDWAWVYADGFKEPHPWANDISLAKLVLELIHNIGASNKTIDNLEVHQEMVIVQKSSNPVSNPNLSYKLREKDTPSI